MHLRPQHVSETYGALLVDVAFEIRATCFVLAIPVLPKSSSNAYPFGKGVWYVDELAGC